MAAGYLILQARTAHDALPISGVRIEILDERGRGIYELTTNESGETRVVSLITLDRSFSLDPEHSGATYVSYNVTAQKEGFRPIYITGIPIYEGETAIQPLRMEPAAETTRSPIWTEIVVGGPAVARQEGHFQPAPEEADSQILRHVVIPDPITVHLGNPSSWAANVQVSFPEYVKNVASSEIYPTWPESSLRANIYAIITFALNRVFTEWYRNRWLFGVRSLKENNNLCFGHIDPADQKVYQKPLTGFICMIKYALPGERKRRIRSLAGIR